ncbi:hypothetical protein [Nostoc sp.]
MSILEAIAKRCRQRQIALFIAKPIYRRSHCNTLTRFYNIAQDLRNWHSAIAI